LVRTPTHASAGDITVELDDGATFDLFVTS